MNSQQKMNLAWAALQATQARMRCLWSKQEAIRDACIGGQEAWGRRDRRQEDLVKLLARTLAGGPVDRAAVGAALDDLLDLEAALQRPPADVARDLQTLERELGDAMLEHRIAVEDYQDALSEAKVP